MYHTDLGWVIGEWGGKTVYAPDNALPLPSYSGAVSVAIDDDDDTWDWYDPNDDDDDAGLWDDPGADTTPTTVYPEVPSLTNEEFSIFTVGYCLGETINAASYPFQTTENGRPLFKYTISLNPTGGTDFVVADNLGDFTVHIDEPLLGEFCSLMKMRAGEMSVKVWGGATSEPFVTTGISTRKVTFDHTKICRGS